MRAVIVASAILFGGCSCLSAEGGDGGSKLDSGLVVDSGHQADAATSSDDAGGDAGGPSDGGPPPDPHSCERVLSLDAGRYCLSSEDVTSEVFAISPDASYFNIRGSRGDRAFVANFGVTLDDGGYAERARAGYWTADWHVRYFPADTRSVLPSEADENGNLCDCEIMGSPSTGYSCYPRVWLRDGGQYSSTGMGPCVSMTDDLWASNSGFTWLHVRSSQTRLVPQDGGLGWDRIHVAGDKVVLSGEMSDGYQTVIVSSDGGLVRKLAVRPQTAVAEAVRVSRTGVILGWMHESLAQFRPVAWSRMGAGEPIDIVIPEPDNVRGFGYAAVANDEGFCATQSGRAIFYLGLGAPPLLDRDLGLSESVCLAALSGGRFVVMPRGGGRQPVSLVRITGCFSECR